MARELLEATTVLFTPETILRWYHKLIAQQYNGSGNCKNPGRPRMSQEITVKNILLIHDCDPLHTEKFASILKAAGVEPVKLPSRSPNLNARAERLVRSVKEECLAHLILSSEERLRYVLAEYLQYYHHERIHQDLSRIIQPQHEGNQGEIICIQRLGGLLKSCHRKAA